MIQSHQWGKAFRLAVITGALLVFASASARSAPIPKWFTETWRDHETCKKLKGSSGTFCAEVSAGKFAIHATISATTPGASGTLDPTLLTSTTPFDINLGGYSFQDPMMSDFQFVTARSKTTAKLARITQRCNAQGLNCNNFKYEQIVLSITNQGVLTITIDATTGSDANGDTLRPLSMPTISTATRRDR
jgi:hypothetical protein